MACRNCALYDLPAVLSKAGRVLSGRAARCLWVSTEVYPSSIQSHLSRRPTTAYMEPNGGIDCPTFQERSK